MEIHQAIALTLGIGWASGLNLYAAVLTLGLLGSTGNIVLPPNLEILQNPIVLSAAGLMFFFEFFADKIPGFDSAWDSIHTFIRIPAGAILAAQAVGPVNPALIAAAGLVGGGLAATSHFTKSGTRIVANSSPEPFSNWALSLGEDAAVIAGIWTALHYPWIFLVLLLAFLLFAAWLLPVLYRTVKRIGGSIFSLFRKRQTPQQA